MLTEQDRKDIAKERFILEIESDIEKLDFQHQRIFEFFPKSTLDADFYMILLRRLYRRIEDKQYDPRVANLKGKFKNLHKKIKIREHYEHFKIEDYKNLPQAASGVVIACGVLINDTNQYIESGNQKWHLNDDHEKFKNSLREFAKLYPFAPKTPVKHSLICRMGHKLRKIFKCKACSKK
ncbi:MAG: hypothetical protein ABID64_00910 [Nitrospirota bacterium]